MRLKVFQAPNIGVAMALVRDEIGPDALILSVQNVHNGVEVTAAQDPALNPVSDIPLSGDPDLAWHGVAEPLAERLCGGNLVERLESALRFAPLPCRVGSPPLILVGAPGAGKTMTAARIATKLKMSGQDSLVITADGRRAGAAEQLAAFTRLLGLQLIVAEAAVQLSKAISRRQNEEPVLIDMPGLNPSDPADRRHLLDCRAASGAVVALVMPAGLDPSDAEELAHGFKDLGATLLIATRLDQSRRLGGILNAAAAGLTLTEAGTTAAVADGLTQVTPHFLAERLLVKRAAPRPEQPGRTSPFALLARAKSELPRTNP